MIKFNLFTGNFDFTGTSAGSSSSENGTESNPFTSLNIKNAESGLYYLIKIQLENVVTRSQYINGVLTIDGVNTIL